MNRFTQTFAILLAGALQIMPLLRNIITSPAANSSFAIILRWTLGSTAALGAVDAVSGATSSFTTPSTFSGSTGTSFSNNVICSIGGGNTAAKNDYFYLQSGTLTSPALTNGQTTTVTLPPGLTFKASWVNGASTIGGILYGTPTTAGTFSTAVWVVSPGNAQLSQTITFTITGSVTPTAPAITSQPSGTNLIAGRTAKFTVSANGTAPLSYFWSKNGTPLANGGSISGANTTTLTVTNVSVTDAGNYSVIVSNSVGTVTSSVAALTVLLPPTISSQPAGQIQTAGGTAQFSVNAGGTAPLSYRWLKGGVNLANSANITGVNSNMLTITGLVTADAGNYSVAVTNVAGSITSSVAPLSVVAAPTIVTPPASQSVIAGATAFFTVGAAGTAPLVYQWLKNAIPLTDGGNVSGSATATLTLSGVNTNDAASYSVIVSNGIGSVTSPGASLTVATPPSIVTQPVGATVLAGSNISFTVSASGSATLAYQWRKNGNTLANGGTVSGATSATLSFVNVSAADAADYSVTVSNAVGSVTSAGATLVVVTAPAITIQPTNVTIAQGATVSFSLTASGTTPMTYQWLRNGGTIPGANTSVLTLSLVTTNDAGTYSAVVTNAAGSAASAGAILTVLVSPAIVTQPANVSIVAGSNVTFNVTASGSPILTYQWRKNTVAISGAVSPAYTLANVSATDAASYSVSVSNAVGGVTSGSATLTVLGPPAITSQPTNATVAAGSNVAFNISVTGTAPMSIQWLKNGNAVSGATSNVLTLSSVTTNEAGTYSAVVTNTVGSAASAGAILTVLVPPAIVTQPANASVVAGSNVTFNVTASGSPTLTYQWRKNGSALANGGSVSGVNSPALTLATVSATDAAGYSVTVSNAVGGVTSGSATLTVVSAPVIVLQPTNQVAPLGSMVNLAVGAAGTGPLNYQWFSGTKPLVNGTNLIGATSNLLVIPSLTTNEENSYFVVVSNYFGSATSTIVSISVGNSASGDGAPVIISQPASMVAVPEQTVVLAVSVAGSGPLEYHWQRNGRQLTDGGNISGSSTRTLKLAQVRSKNSGGYSVVVANSHGAAQSATAALKVLALPVIIQSPADRAAAAGTKTEFSVVTRGGVPLRYQWFKNGNPLADGSDISGSTRSKLRLFNLTLADAGTYSVAVSNLVGSAMSGGALLTVTSAAIAASQKKSSASAATVVAVDPANPPSISAIARNTNGGITLICAGTAGAVYVLQATADLASWTNVRTNTADASGQWLVTDNLDAIRRFYRIKTAQ